MGTGHARRLTVLAFLGGPLGAAALFCLANKGVVQVPATVAPSAVWLMLLAAPVLEEFAFRGALQDLVGAALRPFNGVASGPVTPANLITSIAFAACHLPYHPVSLALSVVLPSLVLGRVREVSGSVLLCVLLHAWFNAWFVALL